MKFTKSIIGMLASAAIIATAALAAQPEGKGGGKGGGGGGGDPPAAFEPEILYVYETRKYKDLRFANLTGDQAKLVHRTTGGVPHFDLSSESKRLIAYTQGDKLFTRSWQTSGADFVSAPDELYAGNRPASMDFSPDDKWLVFNDGARDLYIFEFATHSWEKVLDLPDDYVVHNLAWSPEGDAIFFYGGPPDISQRGIRRVDVSAYVADKSPVGQPELVLTQDVDFSGKDFSVSQPHQGSSPMIVAVDAGQDATGILALYTLTGTKIKAMPWTDGRAWAFNCDNTRGIYQRYISWSNQAIEIADTVGSSTVWSTDNKIGIRTDWLRRTDC